MSKTEILTVIEGEEYIFYTEGSEPLGEYIGFSEFNSIIDDMDKEEAPK